MICAPIPNSGRAPARRRAVTLVEVLVASGIAALVIASSMASVMYYMKTTDRNVRVSSVTNLVEGEMEMLKNQTWYTLTNSTDGICRVTSWPAPGSIGTPLTAYTRTVLMDAGATETETAGYTGINGTVNVRYLPFSLVHTATNAGGDALDYTVRYLKVEITVTVDNANRVRTGSVPDVWTAVTYFSELSGRGDFQSGGDSLFTVRTIDKLKERRVPHV